MWKKAPNALQLTRLQASFFAHCSSYHWLARLFTFSTNRSLAGEWKVCCPNYESNYDYKFKNYDFKEIDATVPRHCAASLCCTTVQRQCAALLCCVTALRYCAKPLCRVMKSRIGKWFMKWKLSRPYTHQNISSPWYKNKMNFVHGSRPSLSINLWRH